MKKLAIVGIFFDDYKDLWRDFIHLFEENWPECPYDMYIVNQQENIDYESKFKIINAGKEAEYSRKVQTALEKINADYYLLLLDDFFLSKKIESNILESLLEYIYINDIKYCSLPLDDFSGSFKGKRIKDFKNMREITPKAEYTVSCQPAIWKKDFLSKCIGSENYNAWIFEGIYSKSVYAHTEEFLDKCVAHVNNLLELKHGAIQGKMLPSTVEYYKNNGYKMKNNRSILSKTKYFKYKTKIFVKNMIPLKIQKKIKSRIKSKSIIEKYNDEIITIMSKMNIY